MNRLDGVIPILAMPFDVKGDIDLVSLDREVDFLVAGGVRTIGFGFASEGFRLTVEERDVALRAVTTRAAGRVEVMAHVTSSSLAAAMHQAGCARSLGANILMVPAPAIVQVSEADQFHYFQALAESARLPMVVQDAPALTGTTMSVGLLTRLLTEVEGVIGLKIEHIPTAPKIAAVAAAMSGAGGILGGAGGSDFFHELERGASGTMPGAGFPEVFLDVLRLYRDGDRDAARRLFNRYLPLLVLAQRSLDTFLWVQKEILRRRGVLAETYMRDPSERLEPGLRSDLDALLAELLPYERRDVGRSN
jgi:4-hydroxy-tetrahydrodipicolinate synthase